MSEHAWVVENLAAYVAGGLTAAERERIQRHVADCADCARAFEEVRVVDSQLDALFTPVRPGPGLEDRSIQALRQMPRPRFRFSRVNKALLAVAAVLFFAIVGAAATALDDASMFPFPDRLLALRPSSATIASDTLSDLSSSSQRGHGLWKGRLGAKASALGDQTADFDVAARRRLHESELERAEASKTSLGFGFHPPAFGRAGIAANRTDVKELGDRLRSDGAPALQAGDKENGRSGKEALESLAEKKEPAKVEGLPAPAAPSPDNQSSGKTAGERANLRMDLPALVAQADAGNKGSAAPPPEPAGRKIIRSGEIDFEIDSFDNAVAVITRLIAGVKGGFITTVNSEKLPNGKVRGSVVVRIPPEKLDALVLDLRKELAKMGDLKGQRIGSQDITKQYTDLESRLRAARTMEERLLKIIKEGKGQVKDLVLAEQELGKWRTKVEELEGDLRFYAHQVALSMLTVNLTEKEIRQAAVITESERVTTGIEVEDVEKAYRAALAAVAEATGRVTKSDLKQHSAGQFNAVLHFEVPADAAGTVRDRLKQLGTVARLDIDRVQQADGGELTVKNGKLKRGPTQFIVSIYNLVSVAPRETVVLRVAATDVAAAYRTLRAAVDKAQGRVTNAGFNEQDQQNISAQLDFDISRASEETLQTALAGAGEVLSRQVTRLPAGENVTDAKVQFNVVLLSARTIPPRETTALVVEVGDVDAALAVLAAQVRETGGRTEATQRHQDPSGRVTDQAPYVVPLTAAPGVIAKIRTTGRVREQRDSTNEQAPAGKLAVARLEVTWTNAEQLVPGEAGLWAQLWRGLSFSLRGLAVSASWLIIGVLVVLPWVLLIYFVVWLVRRLWRSGGTSPGPVTPGSGPS